MKTQIPVQRLVIAVFAGVLALALFLFLNRSFGGPHLSTSKTYELTATFDDSQNLVTKSLVMTRGVKIGEVTHVDIVRGEARVVFTVFKKNRPVRAGTIAQIGHRTIFGEPIVRLIPGPLTAPEVPEGSALRSIPTVEPDEALQVLGPGTREHLAKGLEEFARGLRDPQAGRRMNDTIAGLWRSVTQVRRMTDALHGQEDDVAGFVRNGAVVFETLAEREAALRRLVGSARTVGETFAAERDALGTGLDELYDLLGLANSVLPRSQPLIDEAAKVALRGTRAARELSPALIGLERITRFGRDTAESVRPSNRVALPALRAAAAGAAALEPLAHEITPAFANLVPILRYVTANRHGLEALIANGADSVDNGDSEGTWLHGFLIGDLGGLVGHSPYCDSPDTPGALCSNAYPEPGDAARLEPYRKGSYPRLQAFGAK